MAGALTYDHKHKKPSYNFLCFISTYDIRPIYIVTKLQKRTCTTKPDRFMSSGFHVVLFTTGAEDKFCDSCLDSAEK